MSDRIVATAIIFIASLFATVVGVIIALVVLLGVHGGGPLDDIRPIVVLGGLMVIVAVPFRVARREWRNHDKQ